MIAVSLAPGRVQRRPDGADLAVHHPAGPDHVGPGLGLGQGHLGVALQRGVVVDRAGRRQHPAVAVVGELVEAEVATSPRWRRRPRRATVAQRDVEDPVVGRAATRGRPCARGGTPNSMIPPTPASAASAAALRSESRVCWTTPGIDEIGRGSARPSATNTGRISCRGLDRGLGDQRRIAGVDPQPARAGRRDACCRSATASITPMITPDGRGLALRWDGLTTGSPAAIEASRGRPRSWPGRRPDRPRTAWRRSRRPAARAPRRSSPSAVRCRPGSCAGCGLPAMPTRLRTVEDEVNTTASNLPVLIASRTAAGRRGGADGAVGGDVLDLPAELDQTGGQGLGGDVRPRQEHPVDRVAARRRTAGTPPPDRRPTARARAPGPARSPSHAGHGR